MKRTVHECHEHFFANKFNNLDETEKFPKRHKSPKLTQEQTDHMNSPVSIIETEFVDTFSQKIL